MGRRGEKNDNRKGNTQTSRAPHLHRSSFDNGTLLCEAATSGVVVGEPVGGNQVGEPVAPPTLSPTTGSSPPTTGFAGKVSTARAELGNISM